MSQEINRSRLLAGFASIVIFGFLIRAILWALMEVRGTNHIFEYSPSEFDPLYFLAMTEHFWEYFWYNHVLPPMSPLRDWVAYTFISVEFHKVFYSISTAVLDSFAAGLVYCTLRHLKVWTWLSIGASVLLSIRLLSWDIYAHGGSWDMFNPFLVALYVWTLTRAFCNPSIKSALLSGFAGLLFISSYQTATSFVFPSLLLVFFMAASGKQRFVLIGLALSPPLLMLMFMVFKNGTQHGVYAPTSGAGQNIVQNLNLAISDPDSLGVLRLGREAGYPSWWGWCYEDAERKGVHPTPNVAGFYGYCNLNENHDYDYSGLKAYLADNPNAYLEKIIKQDEKNLLERPWLYSGPISARSSSFSAAYGNVSKRILVDLIKKLPRNYMGRSYLNLKIFVFDGARFEIGTPQIQALLPWVANSANLILVPVLIVSMIASFVFSAVVPVWMVGAFLVDRLPKPNSEVLLVWALSVGFSFGALSSVGIHCCENARHSFNYIPVIMLFGTFSIYHFLRVVLRCVYKLR